MQPSDRRCDRQPHPGARHFTRGLKTYEGAHCLLPGIRRYAGPRVLNDNVNEAGRADHRTDPDFPRELRVPHRLVGVRAQVRGDLVDLALTRAVSEAVSIPVIASGGVGKLQHLADGVTLGRADAVLAASIFHFGEHTVGEAKRHLAAQGIPVRLS